MPTHSLSELNSFKLNVNAHRLIEISQLSKLEPLLPLTTDVLVLGGGSNILFTQDFNGTIILNRLLGIDITQDDEYVYLRVAGGENWHDLVMHCAEQGIGGLENLALIPGTVGAAPVQNIGAYGVEFCQLCDYVETIDLATGKIRRWSSEQCDFSYRESIFKSQRHYFITEVGMKLPKNWRPVLAYGELKTWAHSVERDVTPIEVAQEVIRVRQAKLPDPSVIPNVGSFFKNPVVTQTVATRLKKDYPDMPQYSVDNGVKLAAGWLIDQLGLKAYQSGGAAVHDRQALVLVNKGKATSDDVITLAEHVRGRVQEHFNVILEPEVNFIDGYGYTNLDKVLANV